VAAGAIAKKWLREKYGVEVRGYLASSGPTRSISRAGTTSTTIPSSRPIAAIVPELEAFMDKLRKSGDSCGARINVVATGVPPGWGEPSLPGALMADVAQS
jgi:chorismate synthase